MDNSLFVFLLFPLGQTRFSLCVVYLRAILLNMGGNFMINSEQKAFPIRKASMYSKEHSISSEMKLSLTFMKMDATPRV